MKNPQPIISKSRVKPMSSKSCRFIAEFFLETKSIVKREGEISRRHKEEARPWTEAPGSVISRSLGMGFPSEIPGGMQLPTPQC